MQRVPTIMNVNILPDMGRMIGGWTIDGRSHLTRGLAPTPWQSVDRDAQNDLLRIWSVSKRVESGRGDDDPSSHGEVRVKG